MNPINKKLAILENRWLELTDTQRWKALISEPESFKNFIVQLDNDDTFLKIKNPKNEFEEDFYLSFDEFIGWTDGILTLLVAIGIQAEPV